MFRKIHLWLSVPFGIIIFIICFSGAMLVFESEITSIAYKNISSVNSNGNQPLTIDKILTQVETQLPDSIQITGVVIPKNTSKAWQVQLSKPRRASMFVNQYNGQINGKQERLSFFSTMFGLHRWLLMAPTGKTIVGVSTLIFVFILISGIVVWWPKNKKALKNSLKISINKGGRRFWHDLHVAGGVYAVIFLLAMALTGLTWSFSWYRTGFYAIFGAQNEQFQHGGNNANPHQNTEKQPQHSNQKRGEHPNQNNKEYYSHNNKHNDTPQEITKTNYSQWQTIYNSLKEKYPNAKEINISNGVATINLNSYGNSRASDSYTFDPETGEIIKAKLYADNNRAAKLRGWIFSIHTGSWGGLITRILAFLAALLGASLPITGYYLWIKRSLAKKQSSQKIK